ncbi:MAG: heme exporter protein C [Psychrobacter glaciei]|jgi:heme exporter protein C
MWQALTRLYHKLGSPKWFYQISGRCMPWFLIAGSALMAVGIVWGLAFAPADYLQGNSFRIIYIHVPAAMLSQSAYIMMAVAGVVGLVWKIKMSFIVGKVIAPIGASVAIIALLTGAIWGKPTWGTYWVWDARLTSMLILLFLYFGVIAIHNAIESEEMANKAAAVLAIVGSINIPIIKYSVDWWNTLHQPATITLTKKPTMAPEMFIPLALTIIGFYCWFAFWVFARTRNEILLREHRTKWVKKLLTSNPANNNGAST